MTSENQLGAALLEQGARGLASAAALHLLERRPDIERQFGDDAFASWRDHFEARLLELSAAVLASEPRLFVNSVQWSRVAFESREVPKEYMRASLESLRDVVAEELPPPTAGVSREYVEAGLEGLESDLSEEDRLRGESAEDRLALRYLKEALSGNRSTALDLLLESSNGGVPVSQLMTGVLGAAQREVGTMWHNGEISISHEHFVTATTHAAMALLARQAKRKPRNGRSVMVAVAPGNAHTLGAQIFAARFEAEGWRALDLGEPLPAPELGRAVADFEPDLVALSIALSPQLRGAKDAVSAVREARPEVKILVGGPLLDKVPGVWRHVGADAGAGSVEDALAAAAELFGDG